MCHIVSLLHVASWSCLASPTHSRIYLFPPWAVRNNVLHSTPFACGLLALWAVASPTHTRIYLCHAKWKALTWLVVTKMGVITNIIAQEQTYIKSSQVKCIQIHSLLQSSFIRCFNNQISTTFWKSSKPFLVKIICILSKYFVSISQVTRQGKHL